MRGLQSGYSSLVVLVSGMDRPTVQCVLWFLTDLEPPTLLTPGVVAHDLVTPVGGNLKLFEVVPVFRVIDHIISR